MFRDDGEGEEEGEEGGDQRCHGLQKYVKEKWKILGNSRVKMIMS